MVDYRYLCRVVEWRDGDTLVVDVDLGFRLTARLAVRLAGIDTPETLGKTKAAGLAAKAFAESLAPPGTLVLVRSHKPTRPEEKYGRWLAEVTLPEGEDLAGLLVAAGHARIYAGRTP